MLKVKKIFSALVGAAMAANVFTAMPFSAFADEETTSRIYTYDNYEISYNVTNSWGNTEAISVTISNTGDSTIENWMLSYDDFNGEVTSIWDANLATTDSGDEYIRNAGYNANILPDKSVSFSYTLSDFTDFPDTIIMSQDRLEKPSSGFSADLNVVNDWGDTFNGEIVLTNKTNKPIEWWELTFDSNFTITEIKSSWAASVIDNVNCNYTFKGTYTGIIEPNSSVALGFQAIKNGEPMIDNVSLTEMVFNSLMEENEDSLADIGEAYFKEIESMDDIDADSNGIRFIKNQFLLTAYNDVSYDKIEALGKEYDAEIVGYIELTNDYQFEIDYDVNANDIYQIIDELKGNQLVEFASLNTFFISKPNSPPNDPWDINETIEWDTNNPSGSNWGVEAIDAPGAWEYIDKMSPVKVGLIDYDFQEHEDLDFFNIWHNRVDDAATEHGNHVAGTMAAKLNNDIGISGIIPYNQLYAVSRKGTWNEKFDKIEASSMEIKYMLALLIGNNVKVINYSQGESLALGLQEIKANAVILEQFIGKLINMDYDFVIVSSAGNEGYLKEQASESSVLNNIDDINIRSRIICVGSIGVDNNDDKSTYRFSDFSDLGERVDVVAPGEDIYSTIFNNDYKYWDGTSMATPHVSGTAGLLYSVNPNLSGEQVKKIIIETSGGNGREVIDRFGRSYSIINAKLAVERALETEGENRPKNKCIMYVRDYLKNTRLSNASIRIQGSEAHNNDVDMYMTEGKIMNLITGWYNITIMADGYVTYRYQFHSNEGYIKIYLVEDAPENGYLQITAKDWINNKIANTEFNLYTIGENHNQVKQNLNGTYATTFGVTEMIALAPGYYMPETTTGHSQYTQELYPVAAKHKTKETCRRFGFEGNVETYGFEVYVQDDADIGINFRLAARSSQESLRLDETKIAANVHPSNYPGVYFHFFDTQQVRRNKKFSIGFQLSPPNIERLKGLSDDSIGIKIMVSHGLNGSPNSDTIWVTARDIVENWDSHTKFTEFASISFDFSSKSYRVDSGYWLVDPQKKG